MWSEYNAKTKKSTHEEIDVLLQCDKCDATNFDVTSSGYAWYTTHVNIDADDPTDVAIHDSDTDVGDDFECDWEFRCGECADYCDTRLNQALKHFTRLRQASPEDQLKAYIDQVLFRELTDDKKQLLDQLKGGLINLAEDRKHGWDAPE